MDLHLTDKIAFITGASSGIGAATAERFAMEGSDVIIGYNTNREGAESTVQRVQAQGRRSWFSQLDFSNSDSIRTGVLKLTQEVGPIDILVLCAGQNIITTMAEITSEEWHTIMDINLNGAFTLVQALQPLLRPGGSIVTVASVAAHTGAPHHAHYAAAKAGLVNLTKSLARALAPDIRVNCVAPGITLTAMGQDTVANLAPDYAKEKLLLQRFASPEEIARCIVFLASDGASFVTGATLDVNGGRYMR